jgi:LysM repeat protein
VNTTNPFQLPAWSDINREQRRRARFKKTVISIIAAIVLLLIGLLIEGCRSEREAITTPMPAPDQVQAATTTPQIPMASAAEQKPAVNPQSEPAAFSKPATPDASQSGTVYVVKSGDTLSRIAKTHGTTIQAIEAANGLTDDRILVGAKLKIPTA